MFRDIDWAGVFVGLVPLFIVLAVGTLVLVAVKRRRMDRWIDRAVTLDRERRQKETP